MESYTKVSSILFKIGQKYKNLRNLILKICKKLIWKPNIDFINEVIAACCRKLVTITNKFKIF